MMDRDLAVKLIEVVEKATAALERLAPEPEAKPEKVPAKDKK